MRNLRRKLLSQNFLKSRQLVRHLIGQSSLGQNDLVVEIGPGGGIITRELLKICGRVLAVEIDSYWYHQLHRSIQSPKLTLYHLDFLAFPLPQVPYKVFANLPFALEARLVNRLINHRFPPQDAYLIISDHLAHRLTTPGKRFFISHAPWFHFSRLHHFRPTDFSPVPRAHPVLLRFHQVSSPLLPFSKRSHFHRFVRLAFGQGDKVRTNLQSAYPLSTLNAALHTLSLSRSTKPSHLSLSQWLQLYHRLTSS